MIDGSGNRRSSSRMVEVVIDVVVTALEVAVVVVVGVTVVEAVLVTVVVAVVIAVRIANEPAYVSQGLLIFHSSACLNHFSTSVNHTWGRHWGRHFQSARSDRAIHI